MSLQEVITKVPNRGGDPHRDWLLIKGDPADLSLDTDCALAVVGIDEDSEELDEIIPAELQERGLRTTIDYETVKASINWADRLAGQQDDDAAAEMIRYYIQFDSWPDRLGAPDPPSPEEIIARLDREFFDSLGTERDGTTCRREGCTRGAVQFSAFCRIHHFENVKKKPCPFYI
jgi:hypothetical protein